MNRDELGPVLDSYYEHGGPTFDNLRRLREASVSAVASMQRALRLRQERNTGPRDRRGLDGRLQR